MDKLNNDEKLATRFGIAARKRFEYLFTGSEMGKQYDKLYLSLMKQS